jgi:type IV pilus assembly protein PilF
MLLVLTGCQSLRPGGGDFGEQRGDVTSESSNGKADVYIKLAVGYMQEGHLGMAMQKIKKGIEVDPNNGQAHNILALIYQRIGEKDLAEEHFETAAGLEPRNPYIRNAYGSFLCLQQQYDDADEQYNKALENPLYQTPEVALTNAGTCARKGGDLKRAEEYFRRALQRNPNFPAALYQMAELSYNQGEAARAQQYLERYQRVAKHTPGSLWLAIRVARKLGDRDRAASHEMLLQGNFPDSQEAKLLRESQRK